MEILSTKGWNDYELLDTGDGQRLERFGKYTLIRPDPQICWQPKLSKTEWEKADAVFVKTTGDRGTWKMKTRLPDKWLVTYKNLSFWAKLTPFKHTGIFPEQSIQWDWIRNKIRDSKLNTHSSPRNSQRSILNLFAYTGIASIVCAAENAKVTHLDASKPSVTWAHENQIVSGLENKQIRWIIDDAIKFTSREIKRDVRYDAIIMDPPIYGHGPQGETWDFMRDIPQLLRNCRAILTEKPLFMVVNAYAISASAIMLGNVLNDFVSDLHGKVEVGELALEEKIGGRMLSTGIYARFSNT